jgi:hypothetical protein
VIFLLSFILPRPVNQGKRPSSWIIKAGDSVVGSFLKEIGLRKPVSIFNSVVLPQPEGPLSTTILESVSAENFLNNKVVLYPKERSFKLKFGFEKLDI